MSEERSDGERARDRAEQRNPTSEELGRGGTQRWQRWSYEEGEIVLDPEELKPENWMAGSFKPRRD